MASHDEITTQIMGAWEEADGEPAPAETEDSTVETPAEGDEAEQPNDDDTETEVETETEDEAGEEGTGEEAAEDEDAEEETETQEEGDEETTPAVDFDDPEILLFLEKYNGSIEDGLRGAAQLTHVLGRQGREKAAAEQRVRELERELANAKAFGPESISLSPEQREWVGTAIDSDNPQGYIQEAVKVAEFGLARAVCDAMAEERPYDAVRFSQYIDNAEFQHTEAEREASAANMTVDHGALMSVLVEHFPQMPAYEDQMVTTLNALGANHPLVQNAQSNDPETAASGIIGIFEIAKASRASVSQAREDVRRQKRQEGDDERTGAVVSSGQVSPSGAQTPRDHKLGPGLTLDQLDAAWET